MTHQTNSKLHDQLKKIRKLTQEIHTQRKYWFVRTEGGCYYNAFRLNKIISIGFNKITPQLFKENFSGAGRDAPQKRIRKLIRNTYPELKRPGLAASQIIRFCFEIKKGDVVIIPNEHTWNSPIVS